MTRRVVKALSVPVAEMRTLPDGSEVKVFSRRARRGDTVDLRPKDEARLDRLGALEPVARKARKAIAEDE